MSENTFQKITNLENNIINTKRYSNVSMAHKLNELSRLRKDFYKEESTTISLQDEYKDFCDFNFKLLTSKKLSNALYFGIVNRFISSYEDIQPFDEDNSAFNYATECLNEVNSALLNKCNNLPRIRMMSKATSYFIEKYALVEDYSTEEIETVDTTHDSFDDDYSL